MPRGRQPGTSESSSLLGKGSMRGRREFSAAMNRRKFLGVGAASAMALPQFPMRLLAGEDTGGDRHRGVPPLDRAPASVQRALSSAIAGFPIIEPVFGGIFLPGGNPTQLI